jgi:maltose alpha-D-glucosyltransferase / alpha-amylase
MGDNIYLGDRNGGAHPDAVVAGPQRRLLPGRPPAALSPAHHGPIYGYQSVNVEAQQRDAASLLNWMRRIIEVRKAHQVFGRGSHHLSASGQPQDPRLRARGGGRGRAVRRQPGRVAPSRWSSTWAASRDGCRWRCWGAHHSRRSASCPICLPCPVTAFYWFLLSAEAQAPDWHEKQAPALDLATLVIPEGWRSLQPELTERRDSADRATARLEQEVLTSYLCTRRWCLLEASGVRGVTLGERQQWGEWLFTLPRLECNDGSEQRFFLPLGIRWEGRDDESVAGTLPAALARVRRHSALGLLYDAFADERFVRALAEAIGKGGEFPMGTGRILFSLTSAAISMGGERVQSVRRLPEVGDSRAVLDGQLLLRGYRWLSPGIDPEVEMGRFLAEVSPYPCILPLMGFVEYRAADGVPATLAVLQGYRTNQGDLGTLTLELLGRLVHAHGDRGEEWDSDPAQLSFVTLVDTLGRRVAELHGALAQSGGGEAFDPEPIREGDLTAWSGRIRDEAEDTLGCLGTSLAQLPESGRGVAQTLLDRGGELMAHVADLTPARLESWKIRCHGDLHLGQILVAENDVVVVNFGGDASRPLAERRGPD